MKVSICCTLFAIVLITEISSKTVITRFSQRLSDIGLVGARQRTLNSDWDHFVFSQQWPMSVCIDSNLTHKHVCKIPATVSTWTVHGIWPSLGKSTGPEFCNKTAKYDPDSIATIRDQLEIHWPNLYTDSPADEFWEHEWSKHGTCAMTLDSLSTELKYFSKGLELAQKYDILSLLQGGNIVPSDSDTYQFQDFVSALTVGLGQTPKLNCIYDKSTKTQYVVEIQFCIDKTFNVMHCPTHLNSRTYAVRPNGLVASMEQRQQVGQEEQCNDAEDIAYPTIKTA